MRILFTVLIGLLYCSNALGQELRLKSDLTKIRPLSKSITAFNTGLSSGNASYKTTLEPDTAIYQEHILGPDTICFPDSLRLYNYIADVGGYINGTMGPIQLQNGSYAIVTEHGVNLRVPKKLDYPIAQVYALLVAFAEGSTIVGEADDFLVNVWKTSPVQSPGAVPATFSATFNCGMFPEFPPTQQLFLPIFFDDNVNNYNQISNNMLFSLQTAQTGGDDTLTVYFNSNEAGCDPDNLNNWYFRVMKSEGGVVGSQLGWIKMNQFLGFPDGVGPNVPLLVPVVIYKTEVGMEEAVSADGLTMLNAYPNPSADQTKIRFNLARNGNATIKVLDLTGRAVLPEVKFDAAKGLHEHTLDTRELACGQYICVIQTNQGALATRISIEK